MAKDEVKSGRVTPKGTKVGVPTRGPAPSGRYTPPVPKQVKHSPRWVPVIMGALLAVGAVLILLNYLNLLPGGAGNGYLLVGLGLITAGFITATQWR